MSVSKATSVIQLAILHIKNDNIEGLEKTLKIMPLDKLNDQAEKLLSVFLAVSAQYNRPEAVKVIMTAWSVIYPEEEQVPLLTRMFMWNEINLPTLAFVVLSHTDYTYVEAMDDLMAWDSSPEVTTACQKADKIFGRQPYETYKVIQEHANEMGNYRVEDYAVAWMEETAPYAPIPKWVQNYSEGPLVKAEVLEAVPDIGDVPFTLPPDEEIVELLTKGLSHMGISIDDIDRAKETLLKEVSQSTRPEKIQLLKPIMQNQANSILSGDTELFRIFGPANPLVDQDLTLGTPSAKYGGCRMFLCDLFDYDEEFEYVADWFRGVCDQCNLRIRHRWHAVRKPRPHGGWVGCYCSWECARESIHADREEPDILTRELIKIFEKQTNEIGIQDRLPNDTPSEILKN